MVGLVRPASGDRPCGAEVSPYAAVAAMGLACLVAAWDQGRDSCGTFEAVAVDLEAAFASGPCDGAAQAAVVRKANVALGANSLDAAAVADLGEGFPSSHNALVVVVAARTNDAEGDGVGAAKAAGAGGFGAGARSISARRRQMGSRQPRCD